MNTKMILGGAALLLLASSMAASAYHITGSVGPIGSSHQWNGATAVPDPTTPGAILFALAICEQDDFLGIGAPAPVIATPGMGGLCSMSPGYDASCAYTGGRSNGVGPACQTATPYTYADAPAAGSWVTITMTDSAINAVPFVGQVDGFSCDGPAMSFTYDENFAYTTDDGHVTGFPSVFAGELAPGVPNPLALGSYTVSVGALAPTTFCDEPRPFGF